jgi:signal transduction histidine kinase
VNNLLSNACKYSTADSPISVEIAMDVDRALIAVHNEGEGIPEADQPYVFDRFYRTRTGSRSASGGVGLGLFICKRLVEAMGSQIELHSSGGRGCTFSFWLPLVTRSTAWTGDQELTVPS